MPANILDLIESIIAEAQSLSDEFDHGDLAHSQPIQRVHFVKNKWRFRAKTENLHIVEMKGKFAFFP